MSLHFQVYVTFSGLSLPRSIVNISIYSIHAACSVLPFWPNLASYLTISRVFPTLRLTHSYIAHLQGLYPDSPAPLPVLDGGQKNLFLEEVSE